MVSMSNIDIHAFPESMKVSMQLDVFSDFIGPLTVPLMVAKGASDGPVVVAVAGVHGDEYEGMEALRKVYADLDPQSMSGSFVAIPVANPYAYAARARIAPLHVDGLNLARVFPGDPKGGPSRRLASELLGFVERHVTADGVFIDFHSGSADVPYAPLIGFRDVDHPATRRAEELARVFGLPRIWRIPDSSGPFNAETARRGIVTLGTETTGRAGCDPVDVAAFVDGLRSLLAYIGLCPGWPKGERISSAVRDSIDVLAPESGFFRRSAQLLATIEPGAQLGVIIDEFGNKIVDVAAPVGGELWAMRSMPPVRVGELIATIAY